MPIMDGVEVLKEIKHLQEKNEMMEYKDSIFVLCTAMPLEFI
jgi:CheY-like chemotaxis protein